MGLLSKLKQDTDSLQIEGEKDVIGGSVYSSDLYDAVIKVAYHTVAASGANGIAFRFTLADGKEYRTTEWITSGTAKGCKSYYETSNGDRRYLQGHITADAIAKATTGKSILDLDAEEKIVKVYQDGSEVPQSVPVFMDMVGKKLKLGIVEVLENKSVKDNSGKYVPIADTRKTNEIMKVFNEDGLTTSELKAGVAEPVFMRTWVDKYQGQVIDKTKKDLAPAAGGTKPGFKAAVATADDMFAD